MKIQDYAYLYKDCLVQVKKMYDKEYHIGRICEVTSRSNHGDWIMVWFDEVITVTSNTLNESSSNAHNFFFGEDDIKLLLRPISDIGQAELLHCGKLLCAIPNDPRGQYRFEVHNCHNAQGLAYFSPHFLNGQYFSIYNEKNKHETVGHIEVGWYSGNKTDKRKTKELWKVGGCHELTVYLLSKHFDLFNLIQKGLALDKTKIK